MRQVWQGVQQITNYKPNNIHSIDGDTLMAEELNHFFARFEVKPSEAAVPLPLNHCSYSLTGRMGGKEHLEDGGSKEGGWTGYHSWSDVKRLCR